jgi:hypothetical protein
MPVLVLVAVLVLAGGIAAAVIAATGDSKGSPQTAADDPAEVTDRSKPTDSRKEKERRTAPSPMNDEEAVRCWDGATATTLEACGFPQGNPGLRWVFDGMKDLDCEPIFAPNKDRAATRYCYGDIDGRPVQYHVSHWRHWDEMAHFYDTYRTEPGDLDLGRTDVRAFWVRTDGDLKIAVYYTDHAAPWSMTVHADDDRDALAAADGSSTVMRRRDELQGTAPPK